MGIHLTKRPRTREGNTTERNERARVGCQDSQGACNDADQPQSKDLGLVSESNNVQLLWKRDLEDPVPDKLNSSPQSRNMKNTMNDNGSLAPEGSEHTEKHGSESFEGTADENSSPAQNSGENLTKRDCDNSGMIHNLTSKKDSEVHHGSACTVQKSPSADIVSNKHDFSEAGILGNLEEKKLGAHGDGRVSKTVSKTKEGSNELEEVRDIVTRVWQEIDQTSAKWLVINKNRPKKVCKGWKVVRIFVSSTFSDFHTERELLVKRVIPKLNLWCQSRKIHLIECDLRWGIPKDTTTEDTIEICLQEVERCLEESEGQAFFLNLLGDRYGWIPNFDMVSKELIEKFDLVQSTSITQMETVHGAIGSNSMNAAFFIRNSKVISQIPDNFKTLFVEETELGRQSLSELKRQIRNRFPEQVFDYECQFKDVDNSSGLEKVVLDGLEDFDTKCCLFFKSAIEKYYPEITEDMNMTDWTLLHQDVFIERKGAVLIGRNSEKEKILQFLAGSSDHTENANSENYLIVIGNSGIGKSALLANVVQELKSKRCKCLYNFASASPGSTASNFTVEIFTKMLFAYFGLSSDGFDEISNEDKIVKFKEMVQKVIDEKIEFVFIYDAINQFSDTAVFSLDWLPLGLKGNVKCLISCTEDSRLPGLISEKIPAACHNKIVLNGFDRDDCKNCVETLLGKYNKKLDQSQMDILLSNKEASNPLWLSLVCEELRIFGVFEKVTEKISQLPDSLIGLIETILQRLFSEDESKLVHDTVTLLVCSASGLTETELRWSLGNGKEPLALMTWIKCKVLLQPYLISTGKTRDEDHLNFFHDSIRLIVKHKFLQDLDVKKSYHRRLADSFSLHCDDEARVADELPKQLLWGNEFRKLVEFLRHDKRAKRITPMKKSYYLAEIRCAMMVRPADKNFSFPVYLCTFCSNRMNAFTPLPGLNKDMCAICGARVPFKNDNQLAFLCMRHRKRTAPGNASCHACERVIFLSQANSFNQMYLCNICNSRGHKCIELAS